MRHICKEIKHASQVEKVGCLVNKATKCVPLSFSWSAKNFRLGEARSLTAAITYNFTVVSSNPTTFQNNGSSWNDVTLPVK